MKKIILLSFIFVYGCLATVKAQGICMVTVDSMSTHNIIYWDRSTFGEVDSFRIYRADTASGVFMHIASVSADSLGEYHDFGGHPNLHDSKYKLSTIDSVGVESALSDYHKTIFMDTPGNGVLQWTLYEIENQPNPVTNYHCYRDNVGGFNFAGIGIPQPPTNTSWLDTNFGLFPNADYVMDVTWSISCDPTRTLINTTRSNIRHQAAVPIGVAENEWSNTIYISPNPASDKLTIKSAKHKMESISIHTILGTTVYQSEMNTSASAVSIDVSGLAKGIYFAKITSDSQVITKKIIIQ